MCDKMTKQYPKRPGTSGIPGLLYETKLLSLIYLRAIHDDNIEEFHLASNVDKLGSFNDICFKVKFKGNDKALAVFLQAKHREKNDSDLKLNQDAIVEYFNTYLEVRRKFNPNNKDVLFNGKPGETECLFVTYTNAKGEKNISTYKGSFCKHLNDLIKMVEPGYQPSHNDKDVELLCEILLKEQMKVLAQQMAKCIFGELNDNEMLMQDELVLRYHVILSQKAFDISEIQPEGHRNLSFRDEFFDIDEEYLRIFKDELCTEIIKRRNLTISQPIAVTESLQKKVGSQVIFENGKFVLVDRNAPDNIMLILDKINESQESIRKTVEVAVKDCTTLQKYKVPTSFGNKDLIIKGNDKQIRKILNDLTFKIVRFIELSAPSNIVTIDNSFGVDFLQLSNGIASAVGNLFVFDETTKLMKINNNYKSLGNLSKDLCHKLKKKVDNLQEYRFDVKAELFPKLSIAIDGYSKIIVSHILSKHLFFTSQCNEKELEDTLIYEINNNLDDDVQHVKVTSDAVYYKYHDEIQRWSMESDVGMGTYLDKEGPIYKDAVKHATKLPLLGVLNVIQIIKYKNKTFRKDAVIATQFDDPPTGTIIVTRNIELTVTKIIKHFNNKNIAVLDLEYVLNLSARDDQTLRRELMKKDEIKTLIVIFNKAQINHKLKNIASSLRGNNVIIVTDQNC
ncbi:hypothetical protein PYW07_013363 [Mythimna separata]|uniref:Uncharacterized protein n=1 Tax=Mythimna separata TaxID=271217 RepID=A0AAD7Y6G1_MYTSE|nr:hypothetical protein PYW07_013363 [Mythimna separata]